MKKLIIVVAILGWVFIAYWGIRLYYIGSESGARQMARHILNPAFETDRFYPIMNEECGSSKGWIIKGGALIIYKEGVTINGRHLSPELREFFRPWEFDDPNTMHISEVVEEPTVVIDEAINLAGSSNGELTQESGLTSDHKEQELYDSENDPNRPESIKIDSGESLTIENLKFPNTLGE